jgi:hypothetical protein
VHQDILAILECGVISRVSEGIVSDPQVKMIREAVNALAQANLTPAYADVLRAEYSLGPRYGVFDESDPRNEHKKA